MTVGGRACRLPRSVLTDTALFRGTLGLAWYHPTEDLATLLTQRVAERDTDGVSALLAAVVAVALRRTASSLLTPAVLTQWALRAGLDVDAGVVEALNLALHLGISIGDHQKIRNAVAEARGDSPLEVAEQVLAHLAPDEWEIAVHPQYLDELPNSISADGPGGFPVLRETLFTELGIRPPRLTLSEDPSLPCQGFAFVMGGIRTPPFVGLPPNAMLAIDGHRGSADAVHPVSGSPAAIVPADALLDLTTDDLIGPVALVVMALARVARDHAASTVTATSTADELDLLRQIFPMLAEACRPHLYALTRIRRDLVEEGISVRDLRSVAQAVLDEKMRAGALSDEADLLRGVRLALRPMVTAAAARGASFLTARRLPSDLEAALDRDGRGEHDVTTFAARAVDEEEPGVTLVTSAGTRSAVRSVVAADFPEVSVLAENELAPEAEVTWSSVARPTQER